PYQRLAGVGHVARRAPVVSDRLLETPARVHPLGVQLSHTRSRRSAHQRPASAAQRGRRFHPTQVSGLFGAPAGGSALRSSSPTAWISTRSDSPGRAGARPLAHGRSSLGLASAQLSQKLTLRFGALARDRACEL